MLAGRYRIERFLAGGGMGLVYVAHDQRLADRPCAVKEMFDRFTDPEERRRAIEYFHREADTLSQLNPPAVPAIFDRFGEGNCHYLVMDYVSGTNLEDELKEKGGLLPESQVVDIARQICDLLTYLHSLRPPVIYRDMKPGNVILTPEGRAVLIDFGIARIFTPQGKATLIGTPGFAPPEQYTGRVDERADIYGLGSMLHYLLTGRDPEKHPPFSFPAVHSLKPDASAFVAQAIDHALAYEADKRPQTAVTFKEMLLYGRGLTASPGAAGAARSPTVPLAEPPRAGSRSPARRALGLGPVLDRVPWEAALARLPEGVRARLSALIEELPWKKRERLAALRADPLELLSLNIVNTTRDGTPVGPERERYAEKDIKYLTWEASFRNR